MKNIFKFILIIVAFGAFYYAGEKMLHQVPLEHQATSNSELLFLYGGMIGYILLIVFVVLLQKDNYSELQKYKPLFGKFLQLSHVFIALLFISYSIIAFDIQFSVLMVLIFLFLSGILDYIREKIIEKSEGNSSYPKKLL